jgi:hypothetical protein
MAKSTKKEEKNKKAGTVIQEIESHNKQTKSVDDKLKFWQDKYADALAKYEPSLQKIDELFGVYDGKGDIFDSNGKKAAKGTSSVRKVAFELIESQVDVTIPMPKVTSLSGNENRATTVEHYLMNEIDRLPFERILDEQARITPIAGSSFFLVEWDNSIRTRNTVGKLVVRNLDPKCVIPQPGVSNIDDMDYIFVRMLQSKLDVKNRYDVDLRKLTEMEQTETDMDESNNEQLVTHIYCYYKDKDNKICLFSWIDNTIINDLDNYYGRKEYVCEKCGKPVDKDTEKCEKCGGKKFKLNDIPNETITIPKTSIDIVTGQQVVEDVEIEVPYYTPKMFPIISRTNVSKRNSFLGSSDVEAIQDQQNDLNITMAKIKEKLLKGGSIVTIPENVQFEATNEELKVIKVKNPAEVTQIQAMAIQPNISTDMGILDLNYNIARQTIGITDTFQGRYDASATSGKAKQISTENAAGRLKSKQEMKNAAFSDLYKLMFQFMLAYADEPRSIYYQDEYGKMQYKMFDKRMFIDEDDDGQYFYDDEMVFDTDESSTMANNRQLMWQETRNNFISGAYGDPTDANTIVMYWQMMNSLHYPGSKQALEFATNRLNQQMEAQQEAQQVKQQELAMQDEAARANSQAKIVAAQANQTNAKTKAINQFMNLFTKNNKKAE